MRILFKNARILNLDKQNLEIGCVEVEGDTITNVGLFAASGNYDKVIDCKQNILMPGFVDTHCHTPMTILRSFKDDAPLNEWLFDNILPAEAKLTPEEVYWGQMLGIAECVRGGITTIEEGYFFNEPIHRAIDKAKIRARIGFGPATRDVGMSNLEYLASESKIIKETPLIKKVCFVHSIYTTDDQTISECVEYTANNNIPRSIHLSETLKEVGDCTTKNGGKTPPRYLEDLGYFDRPCLCYHCVHMDKDDLQILADYDVSVSTCPSSNIKLASGIAPIYAMQNKNINITIGTDGVASNNSLDMFKEMFLVATLSKVNIYNAEVVSACEVLKMATENGAKALGFDAGKIEVGKKADIILLDINQPHYYPQDNLMSHIVYSGKSSDVYLTMIGGNIVYENGKFNIGEDLDVIYQKVEEIRRRIK